MKPSATILVSPCKFCSSHFCAASVCGPQSPSTSPTEMPGLPLITPGQYCAASGARASIYWISLTSSPVDPIPILASMFQKDSPWGVEETCTILISLD